MGLVDTKLNKNDNCLTYVLKRTGIESDIEFGKDIPRESLTSYDFNDLKVGDIVVWKYHKHYHLWSTEIRTIDGRPSIFKNNEFAGYHFAVVEMIEIKEEDGGIIITISECVRNDNNYSFPTVKLCNISHDEKLSSTEVRVPTYKLNTDYIISSKKVV